MDLKGKIIDESVTCTKNAAETGICHYDEGY